MLLNPYRFGSAAPVTGLTWNPADSSASYSLENSNQDVFNRTAGALDHVARSISPKSTGKWYFEFEIFAGSGSGETIGLGVESTSLGLTDHWVGGINKSVGYWNNGVRHVNGLSFSANSAYAFAPGDIIGIALDAATGNLWFRKNGTWVGNDPSGTADRKVAAGAPYAVACTPEDASWGARLRSTLTYSIPSGYTQWT